MAMRLPQRKSEQNRKYGGAEDSHLTAEAVERLKEDVRRLERTRPKVVEELSAAREMGDLSENAAYQHAKGRLAGIDRRLHVLKERIKNAVIIERGAGDDGTVCLGCTVTVLVNGRERRYDIVGSQEADPTAGKISHSSPVGAALLGHRSGDRVKIEINGRTVEYEIADVS